MIEGGIPVGLRMTTETCRGKTASRVRGLVVGLMACNAIFRVGRCIDEFVAGLRVAAFTRRLHMRTHQRKVREGVVIEGGAFPRLLRVAFETSCWELRPSMIILVVRLVTRNTIVFIRSRKDKRCAGHDVATAAGGLLVGSY